MVIFFHLPSYFQDLPAFWHVMALHPFLVLDHSLLIMGLMTQVVKSLLAVLETQVWSLNREDPLEEVMATHSIILAWRVPWIEEPSGLQSTRSHRVEHGWAANTFTLKLKFVQWWNGFGSHDESCYKDCWTSFYMDYFFFNEEKVL